METSVAGATARIVPRTVAAGKVSSMTIEISRAIDGYRGSGFTVSGDAERMPSSRSRLSSATYTVSFDDKPADDTGAGVSIPMCPTTRPPADTVAARPRTEIGG